MILDEREVYWVSIVAVLNLLYDLNVLSGRTRFYLSMTYNFDDYAKRRIKNGSIRA